MITKTRDRVLRSLRRMIKSRDMQEWLKAVKISIAQNYGARLYMDNNIAKGLHELIDKTRGVVPKPFNIFYFVLYDQTFGCYYLVAAIYKVLHTATSWTTIVIETVTAEELGDILNNPEEQDKIVEDMIQEVNKFNVVLKS
jgi:hypothetical protein